MADLLLALLDYAAPSTGRARSTTLIRTFPSRARMATREVTACSGMRKRCAIVSREVAPSSSRESRRSRSTSAHQSSTGLGIAPHRLAVDVDEDQRGVGANPDGRCHGAGLAVEPLPHAAGWCTAVAAARYLVLVLLEAVVRERANDGIRLG